MDCSTKFKVSIFSLELSYKIWPRIRILDHKFPVNTLPPCRRKEKVKLFNQNKMFFAAFESHHYLIVKMVSRSWPSKWQIIIGWRTGRRPTNKQLVCGIKITNLGSGCGAVGRAVASDTRDPWFESSHGQNLYVVSTALKRQKERKKRPGMVH